MNIFNLKSYADDQGQMEESEPEEVRNADGTGDVNIEIDEKQLRLAIDYSLTAIKQGNDSKWTVTGGGVLDPRSYLGGMANASGRAKASAGSTRNRGEGAVKFLRTLIGEANSVDKRFQPLFNIFSKHEDFKNIKSTPNESWVAEILQGWEKVSNYKSWYGENSAYDFIVGRSDSLTDKFMLAWSNVNRFRETNVFEIIGDLFSASRGRLDSDYSSISDFMQSVLLWRAVVAAMKKVVNDSVPSVGSDDSRDTPESSDGSSEVSEESNTLILENIKVSLDSVRSANITADVDRRTKNIMIDRERVERGESVVLVFYFSGRDSERISQINQDSASLFLREFIEVDRSFDKDQVGDVIGIEREDDKTKIFLEVNSDIISQMSRDSSDTFEVFKIRYGKDYLKVEASDLELYNQIKKIAYSTTTSYYTVTSPSGKKVDLSIADMVMGRGYVADSGNRFKAKSLSKKVLKKKKKK